MFDFIVHIVKCAFVFMKLYVLYLFLDLCDSYSLRLMCLTIYQVREKYSDFH